VPGFAPGSNQLRVPHSRRLYPQALAQTGTFEAKNVVATWAGELAPQITQLALDHAPPPWRTTLGR